MTPLPESVLHTSIQDAMRDVADAKSRLKSVTLDIQSKCEHRFVSEMPYRSGGLPAERICNHCRLIEEGSHWSGGKTWSRHDFGKSELGNVAGRIVQPISSDEFYKMRIPV